MDFDQLLLTEAKADKSIIDIILSADSVIRTLPVSDPTNFKFYSVRETPMLGANSIVYSADISTIPRLSTTGNTYNIVIAFYDLRQGQLPSASQTGCRVYCSCAAYYFYFGWYNFQQQCHYGRRPRPYIHVPGSHKPSVNPGHKIGCCKHIAALARYLQDMGKITQ